MDLSKIERFEQLSFAQWVALGNRIGGLESVIGTLQGEFEVALKRVVNILFDKHGRRIPKGLSANVCDANREFYLRQPDLLTETHYVNRMMRLRDMLGVNMNISAEEFKNETEHLLRLLRGDVLTANLTNGVYLPVVLPKLQHNDLGVELERCLAAVGKSYVGMFPEREFRNRREGALDGAVSIVPGSRHKQLIKRMKKGPVIGLYFPSSLQGFSVDAAREQIASLPKGFILSGLDIVIAMIMYPDVLVHDWGVRGFDLVALSWQSAEYSFFFAVGNDLPYFDNTYNCVDAYRGDSGGLLFVDSEVL
ncbi:hypothetical protein CL630_02965 [bacterium]|nr:hypothetical protein [bacterium]|tara:strand:- start:5450 stop:6370 length:921 start_codon:yes stop_codon:yes gene_type:complete